MAESGPAAPLRPFLRSAMLSLSRMTRVRCVHGTGLISLRKTEAIDSDVAVCAGRRRYYRPVMRAVGALS